MICIMRVILSWEDGEEKLYLDPEINDPPHDRSLFPLLLAIYVSYNLDPKCAEDR